MSAVILDGKIIKQQILQEIAKKVELLSSKPGLAVIIVGDDPASHLYVNNKQTACHQVGFYSQKIALPQNTQPEFLLSTIDQLNQDPKIHGILCQFPLPKNLRYIENQVINRISPKKDVDGFHPLSSLVPCTAKGVMALIEQTGQNITGLHTVVMGRSHTVGKPIAEALTKAKTQVSIVHSKTPNPEKFTKQADILVVAIGKPKFVTKDMIKPGCIVIDVGINRTDSGLVGDVDFDAVKEVAGFLSPVPGGVGPTTIAMLMQNVLTAYHQQTETKLSYK